MSKQDILDHRKNKFLNIGRDKSVPNHLLSSEELFSEGVKKIFDVRKKIGGKKTYALLLLFLGFLSLTIFQLFF